ncbi:MAG: phosphatase PAP2 family protein [Roseibacillus sp.]
MTRRWILLLYVLPALLLAAGSVPFLVSDLDLQLAHKYFNEKVSLWIYAERQPWAWLYSYGPIPAIVTAVLAFSLLTLSIGRPKLARYRKVAAFLALALLLGPGLVANSIFKENWGRPRPRQVESLGGREKFEPLLTIDKSSDGKSFVCGHATMGFYFFAGGLALLAARRRKTGILVLVGAAGYGTFIGVARIVQGGHFASDVLWSAGVIWFTSAGLLHAFGLHRNVLYEPKKPVGANLPRWVPVATLTGLLALIGFTTLAFPYARIKATTLINGELARLPDTVILNLDLEGSVELERGEELKLETESRGIGFPKSRLKNDRIFIADGAEVTHRRSGYFTKLHVRTRITLPANRVYKITLGKRVKAVYILPPGEFDPNNFAHVRLTSGFRTELMNLKTKVVDEDFFGRKTRAFSF